MGLNEISPILIGMSSKIARGV